MRKTLMICILIALGACEQEPDCSPLELGQEWANSFARSAGELSLDSYFISKIPRYDPMSVETATHAKSLAVIVWSSIYGQSEIEAQAPHFAYLVGDVWVVTGSLPKCIAGGTAKIMLSKHSGEVLFLIHGNTAVPLTLIAVPFD